MSSVDVSPLVMSPRGSQPSSQAQVPTDHPDQLDRDLDEVLAELLSSKETDAERAKRERDALLKSLKRRASA
jgi:hypothetical protein